MSPRRRILVPSDLIAVSETLATGDKTILLTGIGVGPVDEVRMNLLPTSKFLLYTVKDGESSGTQDVENSNNQVDDEVSPDAC